MAANRFLSIMHTLKNISLDCSLIDSWRRSWFEKVDHVCGIMSVESCLQNLYEKLAWIIVFLMISHQWYKAWQKALQYSIQPYTGNSGSDWSSCQTISFCHLFILPPIYLQTMNVTYTMWQSLTVVIDEIDSLKYAITYRLYTQNYGSILVESTIMVIDIDISICM